MNIDEYNASLQKQDQQTDDKDIQGDMDVIFDFDDNDDENGDFSSIDEQLLDDSEDDDDNEDSDENEQEQDEETADDNEHDEQDEQEQQEEKKVQSPEENARFAEMRRRQQAEAEFERQRQSTPEYQIAKMLADRYGVSVEQMQQQLQENQLREQAQREGVPVEYLKRQQAMEQQMLEQQRQFQMLQYKAWENRITAEKQQIKQAYPYLEDTDIEQAVNHLFDIRNTELPLEQAVFAVHGKKIADAIKEQARQDALAEISGRTKSPIIPQGGKPNPTATLTAEEKYVAKMMGVSEKDYLKYKNQS